VTDRQTDGRTDRRTDRITTPKTASIATSRGKNRDAQKKLSGREVCGLSAEAGRESMGERFVKEVGLEAGVKERGSYGW